MFHAILNRQGCKSPVSIASGSEQDHGCSGCIGQVLLPEGPTTAAMTSQILTLNAESTPPASRLPSPYDLWTATSNLASFCARNRVEDDFGLGIDCLLKRI